jgi:site-specific recombinase XerD
MAMDNHSLQIIAKALGHKTIAATQIYSRLSTDPVRKAMESAQNQIRLLGELSPENLQES